MKFDPKIHHRRSIRLPGYDYSQAGAYFVTIVTQGRECLFGEVVDGVMVLNQYGEIVQKWWHDLPTHFPCVETGAFVIMPNHAHGVIIITDDGRGAVPAPNDRIPTTGRGDPAPTTTTEMSPIQKPTLGQVVAYFKYKSTKEMNALDTPGIITKFWQRNYYERIIRNDEDYNRIHLYIEANPANWLTDNENLAKPK